MSSSNRKLNLRRLTSQYECSNIKIISKFRPEKVLSFSNLTTLSHSQSLKECKISNNKKNIIYAEHIPNVKQTNTKAFLDIYSMIGCSFRG